MEKKQTLAATTQIITLIFCTILAACTPEAPPRETILSHARWLTMSQHGDTTTATIANPWTDGHTPLHTYNITPHTDTPRTTSADGTPTTTLSPARRAVSATTLHAFLAHRLGAHDRLAGVMDKDYVVAPSIKDLTDMGSSTAPNLERLHAAACDMLLASPFEHAGYGALETLGAPIIECADYMETTPLGRAEWMRFYGRLFDRAAQADSLFAAETDTYEALCRGVAQYLRANQRQPHPRPTILYGMAHGQSWHVPGGESYLSRLFIDAGANYPFADDHSTGSLALDLERVYSSAADADVWLIVYGSPTTLTYDELRSQEPRYTKFKPFKEHRIWACNTLQLPYYEATPFAPSLLLRDIIAILYPQLLPGYTPKFFQPL